MVVLATSSAWAGTASHIAGQTFTDKAVTFSYPNNWSVLSDSVAKSIGAPFANVGHGLTLTDVGGVKGGKKGAGAVAIAIKVAFNKKFQGQLKGHHALFLNGVIKGIANNKGIRVVKRGQGTLSGQPAKTVEVVETGKNPSHQKFYVAIAGNAKSMYMTLYLTVPANKWGKFSSDFNSIEQSVQYR